jgi:hypothetical protein
MGRERLHTDTQQVSSDDWAEAHLLHRCFCRHRWPTELLHRLGHRRGEPDLQSPFESSVSQLRVVGASSTVVIGPSLKNEPLPTLLRAGSGGLGCSR